jgi:hypothetical protein
MAQRDETRVEESRLALGEYTRNYADRHGLSVEQAARELYVKQLEEEIRLIDPDPPMNYISYLLSLYSTWFWLLLTGIGLTISSIYVLPQVRPFTWLRVLMGFLMALYLPGYSFIEALYPKKSELEELERFALSIGLSIALTPLTGLVLNYTPWGIRLNPIMASLSLLSICLGLFGVYRKYTYHLLSLAEI